MKDTYYINGTTYVIVRSYAQDKPLWSLLMSYFLGQKK